MTKYLGEFPIDITTHETYKTWTEKDLALYYIGSYGQIDGAHHKQWVLDQVVRILLGATFTVNQARWDDDGVVTNDRIRLSDPTPEYEAWVKEMLGDIDEDGNPEYGYDEGICP